MSAHRVSPSVIHLLDLYLQALRKIAEGCQDDKRMYIALSVAADHVQVARNRARDIEEEALVQADLEASLREEGR